MSDYITRDMDTELIFNPHAGVIALEGPRNQEAAIFITVEAATELAAALLAYATPPRCDGIESGGAQCELELDHSGGHFIDLSNYYPDLKEKQ